VGKIITNIPIINLFADGWAISKDGQWWIEIATGRKVPVICGATAMFAPFMRRFRFYNTGTETGATPIAAEDNITHVGYSI